MNGHVSRLRLYMVLAFMATLVLGSYWMLEVMRKSIDSTKAELPASAPDYYVEQFNFIRMSETGHARYHISGTKLMHDPRNDSYAIQQPIIRNFSSERPPMTLRSERALVENNNTKVHLYNNVQMDRPASSKAEALHMTSEYLLMLPDDDIVQTDKPVTFRLGQSILHGTGMFANNATREIRLLANVRSTYRPLPH